MAEEGQVIGCHTVESWKEQLKKGIDAKKLVVVDFTASWCPPCRMMAPIFVELAKKMPHVLFLKVDVDELQSVSVEWEVEAMPTFLLLKEGQVVDKVVGAHKEKLEPLIAKHATDAVTA
ncbi:thioredoxin H-type 2-like [Rhodamnia argentea]|uniref:Thioredoxin H-type 2-like n=1 Tax=Rhodamnia argentea TaxID=178133 RepID=A0A8B8NZA7_9MYRT|nr:thioredoxin H-type 2-like [Rhodamnia argentea]